MRWFWGSGKNSGVDMSEARDERLSRPHGCRCFGPVSQFRVCIMRPGPPDQPNTPICWLSASSLQQQPCRAIHTSPAFSLSTRGVLISCDELVRLGPSPLTCSTARTASQVAHPANESSTVMLLGAVDGRTSEGSSPRHSPCTMAPAGARAQYGLDVPPFPASPSAPKPH
jgi:hypothetical protein